MHCPKLASSVLFSRRSWAKCQQLFEYNGHSLHSATRVYLFWMAYASSHRVSTCRFVECFSSRYIPVSQKPRSSFWLATFDVRKLMLIRKQERLARTFESLVVGVCCFSETRFEDRRLMLSSNLVFGFHVSISDGYLCWIWSIWGWYCPQS